MTQLTPRPRATWVNSVCPDAQPGSIILPGPSDAGGPHTQSRHLDLVDSTQSVALDWARAGAPAGSTVVARAQRAGRGRLDHAWASPPGGLYLSMVLPEPSTRALLVPLAVGRAVADALGVYTDRALLKWPNDLVVPNAGRPARKLAGTLIDRIDSPTLGPTLVVGVGVNVDSEPSAYPPDLKDRVVQLSELAGRPVPVAEVERAVVPAVAGVPATLATPEGAARLLARLRRELFGLGRPVRVDGVSAGVLDSVDDDGALLLASGGVTTRVVAGEVALEGSG